MILQTRLDKAFARLQEGNFNDAIRMYTDILGQVRHQPDALYMLGSIAYKLGSMDQALEFATAVTDTAPGFARAWVLRALALRALKRAQEAFVAARKALALDANLPDAWECGGMALMHCGKWAEARAHFEQALEYVPDNATLHGCYALVLAEQGDLTGGWLEVKTALAHYPETPVALMAKTAILAHAGYYDLALRVCRAASKHEKVRKTMAFGEAENNLITGRFEEGYALLAADEPAHAPKNSLPDWQGEESRSIHLALFGEQGYGDTLQFMRFANEAADKVGQVTLRLPVQLERLARASFPHLPLSVYQPLVTDERRPMKEIDPVFDFPPAANRRCSFIRLPHVLHVGPDTRKDLVPYLRAEPALSAVWRGRLEKIPRPRIGLVWSGNPQNGIDHTRSIPFPDLAMLIEKFKPHIVSMQTGPHAMDARDTGLYDASPYLRDFAESAALLEELDVLVSVCTAPAHLAGGLGRPVWVALAFNADWRWLIAREDSVWYPTARLFRQPRPGDWHGVVRKLCDNLQRLVGGDRRVLQPIPWTGSFPSRHPQAVPLPDIEKEPGFGL